MRICFCAPFLVQSTATVCNIHLPYLFIPSRHWSVFKFSHWHKLSHTLGDFYHLQNRWKFSKNWFVLAQVGVDFKRDSNLFLVQLIFYPKYRFGADSANSKELGVPGVKNVLKRYWLFITKSTDFSIYAQSVHRCTILGNISVTTIEFQVSRFI